MMHKFIKFIQFVTKAVLIVLLMLPTVSNSQESNFGNWLIYIGNKKLNDKWNIHNEIQYRNYDAIGDLEQLLLRTGLGYNISENNNNILLGYGYILSENYLGDIDEKTSINEHRIFQQFTTKQKIGKLGLSHRYRFEQRFIDGDFKLRVRYFLAFNYPLFSISKKQKPIYASAYNEIFLNTKSSVFDRNRVYFGLGYNFSTKIRLEVGYMNQFFETSSRDQLNIISFITF